MTKLLKQAFAKASELPSNLQDELARELLDELDAEKKWDQTLLGSQDMLEKLAQKALEQHDNGKTKQMGPDEL